MAGVEEVAQRIGRGPPAIHAAAEPAVGLEHGAVVETGATRGEQPDPGLALLDLRVPALARAPAARLADHPGQSQGAQRLQHPG